MNEKIAGNLFDKYGSRNPVVQVIMRGFDASIAELVAIAAPQNIQGIHDIHDIGCGEGTWVMRWRYQGLNARGSDASGVIFNPEAMPFCRQRAIEGLDPAEDSADLVTCLEVLEHVADPHAALRQLRGITRRHIILSVPREPLWRILNMARGAWLADWGNTPGHVNHWSRESFIALVSQYFDIVAVRSPLPWTILLCKLPNSLGSLP